MKTLMEVKDVIVKNHEEDKSKKSLRKSYFAFPAHSISLNSKYAVFGLRECDYLLYIIFSKRWKRWTSKRETIWKVKFCNNPYILHFQMVNYAKKICWIWKITRTGCPQRTSINYLLKEKTIYVTWQKDCRPSSRKCWILRFCLLDLRWVKLNKTSKTSVALIMNMCTVTILLIFVI